MKNSVRLLAAVAATAIGSAAFAVPVNTVVNGSSGVIQTDFPTVDLDSMTICHYAGSRFRRTYGVEFRIPNNAVVPSDYVEVQGFECLF